MPRRPVLILSSLLLAASLAACSEGSTPPGGGGGQQSAATDAGAPPALPASREPVPAAERNALTGITASGPVATDTAPSIHLGRRVSVTETQQRVLTPGKGTAASRDSWVVARTVIFNGTTGKQVYSSWQPVAPFDWFGLSQPDMLAGMTRGLLGAQKGSRVVIAIPPKEGISLMPGGAQLGSGNDTLVVVADVKDVRDVPREIQGPMTQPGGDLPTVGTTTPGDGPSISLPAGKPAPTVSRSHVLIQGKGKPVAKGQTVIVNYKGVLWNGGATFDSSWKRGGQFTFQVGLGKVIKAWDSQLVGKPVGSRVMIVAPPAEAYGAKATGSIPANSTLVFVVDILDAS